MTPNVGDLMQREHPKIRVEYGWGEEHKKTCNISETVQDRTKVTITD